MHRRQALRRRSVAVAGLGLLFLLYVVTRTAHSGPAMGLERSSPSSGNQGTVNAQDRTTSTMGTTDRTAVAAAAGRSSRAAAASRSLSSLPRPDSPAGDLRNPSALGRWKAAVAQRSTNPADVVFVGDSITEGYFVTDQDRWISGVRRDLQSTLNPPGTPGGEGFIPAWHLGRATSGGIPEWSQRWTVRGFPADWSDSGFGLGRRALVFTSTSETASITVTGDRFWLAYTEGPTEGLLRVTVDGGLPTIVDTHAAVTRSGRIWDSGALPVGAHTVTVASLAGSQVVLDGIMPFNGDGGPAPDRGKGIRIWDGGHSRYTSSEFGGEPTAWWAQGLDNIRPDLVVVELGSNDQYFGHSPDLMAANLGHLVDVVRNEARASGAPSPSIAFMPVWAAGNKSEAEWEAYRAAILRVADTQGCAVLDVWNELHQAPAKPAPGGLFVDVIHPSVAGHRWLGDLVAHLLQP